MDINLNSLPIKNPDFELTELDGEIILFSVSQEKAVYFNQTAQLIWRLCEGQQSVSELIDNLKNQYPKETDIESQVITALTEMLNDCVISLSETTSINLINIQ